VGQVMVWGTTGLSPTSSAFSADAAPARSKLGHILRPPARLSSQQAVGLQAA
jgi:hypothetical protein